MTRGSTLSPLASSIVLRRSGLSTGAVATSASNEKIHAGPHLANLAAALLALSHTKPGIYRPRRRNLLQQRVAASEEGTMESMVRGSAAPRERGPAYLTVVVDNREVQRRPLDATTAITLGRSLDCDLWLDDPRLSRTHCRLEPALEGDGWVVIDLNSRNGVYVNAKRIDGRSALNHRDVITIGHVHLKFSAHGYVPPRPTDPSEAMLMPAKTRAALNARTPTPHHAGDRPLPTPTPRDTSADSTISTSTPGETIVGKPLPFTRPPARPIVKPVDE
jgi:pSer/pThr/pTyr-binding forkhead associated (FHA) protein